MDFVQAVDEESPFSYSVYCSNVLLELKLSSSDEQTSQSITTEYLEKLSTEKKTQPE